MNEKKIIIRGLRQNNPSIVFDTIAAESQRQMNETYTAFMRGRRLISLSTTPTACALNAPASAKS